jgi:putative ATP-dependent endonuclease of the OLD family
MKIARLDIENFRCINSGKFFPLKQNVILGPNNCGKTAILESLNFLLNPEMSVRSNLIDENDFYLRHYLNEPSDDLTEEPETKLVRIQAVLDELNDEDIGVFGDNVIPWNVAAGEIVESTEEGIDPFSLGTPAIRVAFEGWYNPEEDDFEHSWVLRRSVDLHRDECDRFTREHKRRIGFLIYRDLRALTRPITLESQTLFGRLLQSQNISLKHFEEVLAATAGSFSPMTQEPDFENVLTAYKEELERVLQLSTFGPSSLTFELTDRTREQIKEAGQLYVGDQISLPIQKMGAGTRSLAMLAILTLIMRRRKRGILALEEPETFLFPHAQRRIVEESLSLADQVFVTTHSPYVLEKLPATGVGRVYRTESGEVSWTPVSVETTKKLNLYTNRLRHVFSEALLGKGVLIVEGESDKWWVNGMSSKLHGISYDGLELSAFDLQGVTVVNCEGNGEPLKIAEFFEALGMPTVMFLDRIEDPNVMLKHILFMCPTILMKHKGLEQMLSESLPINIIKAALCVAPYVKSPNLDESAVSSMPDSTLRAAFRTRITNEKGSASFHEWLMSLVNENEVPNTLTSLLIAVNCFFKGSDLKTHTLVF